MKNHGTDTTSDLKDSSQAKASSEHENPVPRSLEQNIARRKSVVSSNEAAVLSREKLVSAREDALDTRELENRFREKYVSSRERDVSVVEAAQTSSEKKMTQLLQANEHLVITTMEAQMLTEQVQLATAQLELAKASAEKASLAKSDFLSSMSHELRTPLNAILGFAQLLEGGSPTPTPDQNLRIREIIKAGWYLLELINEILDLAVIESGKVSLSREPTSLTSVMLECQAMIEAQAQSRGINIKFFPFDSSLFANADRTRLKQILVNLLSNAVKYNRENGSIDVVCTLSTPDRIRISVKDTGFGLAPDKLAQLFQPFNRLGQEVGPEEGTGIGLVVTKQLVELMGGSIGVESTVGVGSEFWVELARDLVPQLNPLDQTSALSESSKRASLVQHTVLCVEDNPANLLLIEQIVAGLPHIRLLTAGEGRRAIALARAHRPDVILMDINLPGMSGIEALTFLREDPVTAHIPVIALSANAMPHDVKRGLNLGFFRYLTKPINVAMFAEALDVALDRESKPPGNP